MPCRTYFCWTDENPLSHGFGKQLAPEKQLDMSIQKTVKRLHKNSQICPIQIPLQAQKRGICFIGPQTAIRASQMIREGLQGGRLVGLPSAFFAKKLYSQFWLYLSGSVYKFSHFCLHFLLFFNNGQYVSHRHFVCRFCVKSRSLYFWMNNIWLNEFSWNKLVRGDSTGLSSDTRSEKDWEPLVSLPWISRTFK